MIYKNEYSIADPNIVARRVLRPIGIEWLLYCRRHLILKAKTERYRRDDDPVSVLAKIREKRLIFTVTAGRTGSLFVQKLLSVVPNVTSVHEPEPAFHRYRRRIARRPDFAREFLLHYKLPAIADVPTPYYAELSNVFCKGYLEPLLELGITPDLILLRREPQKIALSYLERYTIPGRTYYGLEYLLDPSQPGVLKVPNWRRLTDYQLIFWYVLEIERRQRLYSQLVLDRGGKVCDISAEELHDSTRFLSLLDTLGLLDGISKAGIIGQHATITNTVYNKNTSILSGCRNLEQQEEEIWGIVSQQDTGLRDWIEERYRT